VTERRFTTLQETQSKQNSKRRHSDHAAWSRSYPPSQSLRAY